MNMQKTEIEIVHSAYGQLWKQVQVKRLVQRLNGSDKRASRIHGKRVSL